MKIDDLTNCVFGKLTVISRAENIGKRVAWNCICECGNKKVVSATNLKSGNVKSCGCLKKEVITKEKTIHGKRDSKLYNVYYAMRARCYNKNTKSYQVYGERGIKLCDDWLGKDGFLKFYNWAISNGYKDGMTIERIDCNGNYSPENCCWISKAEQSRNLRTNVLIDYSGETHPMAEWAEILNVNYKKLQRGIKYYGFTFEQAVEYARGKTKREISR